MKKVTLTLTTLVALTTLSGAASANFLLSLDARAPGASPTTQWDDLSGVNAPLVPNSTTGGNPVYNAGAQVYEFGRGSHKHWFETVGSDEDNFDFPAPGFSATEDPNGVMTVVAYMSNTGFSDNTAFWSKGAGNLSHHSVAVENVGGEDRVLADRGVGNNTGERAIAMATPGVGGTNNLELFVVHFNGRQAAPEWEIYYNGSTTNIATGFPGIANSGDAYTGNSDQLHIGSPAGLNPGGEPRFFGEIQFVEVYSGPTISNSIASGMTPSEYSAHRFANLNEIVTPEPGALTLLCLGGLALLGRRR